MRSAVTFLHVCDHCGAYWEHSEHKLRRLSDEEACQAYPRYFRSRSGRRRRDSLGLEDDDERSGTE
jgi:hypothetical protein